MKKNYIYYALMAVSLLVAACGSDDDSSPRSVEVNKNANGRDKSEYAVRTEMPKVMKGTNYVILVKHDDEIGVNYIVEWDCNVGLAGNGIAGTTRKDGKEKSGMAHRGWERCGLATPSSLMRKSLLTSAQNSPTIKVLAMTVGISALQKTASARRM